MPLTPQEVASKVFGPTRMRRGYDENEVDAFLDVVETELTRLTTENERLRRELESTGRSPASIDEAVGASQVQIAPPAFVPAPEAAGSGSDPGHARESTSAVSAVSAGSAGSSAGDDGAVEQRVARMLVLAQQTADAAISEAQSDADRLRGEARTEAERLVNDARYMAAEEIGALEQSKASLESQVEQLEAFEREYRQRLRAYLTVQLSQLDHDAGPAAVAGYEPHVLDVSDSDANSGLDMNDLPAGSAGLSEPPGFGQVWSPDNGGGTGRDPLVGVPPDQDGRGGSAPYDPEGQGQRSGGYGGSS